MDWKRKYEDISLLFHGTNRPYFEQMLTQFGRYEHIDKTGDREYVQLTSSLEDAIDYALRRSIGRKAQGTLLLVRTSLILPRLERIFLKRPAVRYLCQEEFTPFHLSMRSEKIILPGDIEEITRVCREEMGIDI